ncbi:uncharacterized protein BKA78DRAFT_138511 [Phyllosticta capitalensis]|uniref:uncharacterized protein n=1 Tax=Phyllosticta capitalensis TaxID=121624 RepID=UPI003131B7E2
MMYRVCADTFPRPMGKSQQPVAVASLSARAQSVNHEQARTVDERTNSNTDTLSHLLTGPRIVPARALNIPYAPSSTSPQVSSRLLGRVSGKHGLTSRWSCRYGQRKPRKSGMSIFSASAPPKTLGAPSRIHLNEEKHRSGWHQTQNLPWGLRGVRLPLIRC